MHDDRLHMTSRTLHPLTFQERGTFFRMSDSRRVVKNLEGRRRRTAIRRPAKRAALLSDHTGLYRIPVFLLRHAEGEKGQPHKAKGRHRRMDVKEWREVMMEELEEQ